MDEVIAQRVCALGCARRWKRAGKTAKAFQYAIDTMGIGLVHELDALWGASARGELDHIIAVVWAHEENA